MNIVRKKKQGKADLEGNQSRRFLKCVDKLEVMLMMDCPDRAVVAIPYVEVLKAFNSVVHSCFGVALMADYKDHISRFSKLYRDLEISVTPKVRNMHPNFFK
jgi:hypothetical protein